MRKTRTYPESQQYNPRRAPDWRWLRATMLVATGMYASEKRDDEPTCRAVRFLRGLKRCCSERGVRNLTRREPSLMMAVKLYQEGGPRCRELHSRVLARQSPVIIAEIMGLTLGMVETYIELFFAVGDRIGAVGYVMFQVIDWPADGSAPSADQFMLAIAFHYGPAALDAYLDYLPHQGKPHDLETAVGRTRESFELWTAAHSLPADEKTQKSLAMKAPFVLETGSNLARTRSASHVLSAETARIIGELPWATQGTTTTTTDKTRYKVNDGPDRRQAGKVA